MHRSSGKRGRRLFKTSATREGVGRLIEEHTYTFSTVIGQPLKRKNKANEGTPRAQRDRNNENK